MFLDRSERDFNFPPALFLQGRYLLSSPLFLSPFLPVFVTDCPAMLMTNDLDVVEFAYVPPIIFTSACDLYVFVFCLFCFSDGRAAFTNFSGNQFCAISWFI